MYVICTLQHLSDYSRNEFIIEFNLLLQSVFINHETMSQQLYDKSYIYFVLFCFVLFDFCKSSPVTGPEGPREFWELKVPRFRDNGTGWW